jgi:hypothetical protein
MAPTDRPSATGRHQAPSHSLFSDTLRQNAQQFDEENPFHLLEWPSQIPILVASMQQFTPRRFLD